MKKIFFVLFIAGAVLIHVPVFCAEELSVEELTDAGLRHFYAQDFDKAIEYAERGLAKATDDQQRAKLFFNLSSAYLEKGIPAYWKNKDDAFYRKSLEYAEECLDIVPYFWQAWANMATVYMNMNELKKADYYYTQAEKYVDVNSPYYRQLLEQHSMVKGGLKMREMQGGGKP